MANENDKQPSLYDAVDNAVIAAGLEMGETGDHWPAIKAVLSGLEEDREQATISQDMLLETKKLFLQTIQEYETLMHSVNDADAALEMKNVIDELREQYDAIFSPVSQTDILRGYDAAVLQGFSPAKAASALIENYYNNTLEKESA